MSANLRLSTYSFILNRSRQVDEIAKLNEPFSSPEEEKYDSFIDLVYSFLTKQNSVQHSASQKVLFFNNDSLVLKKEDEYSYIWGSCKYGEYGSKSDIYNVETRKVDFHQKANQAGIRDFYFCIVVPKDKVKQTGEKVQAQKGLIFYQSKGKIGIKTIFEMHLKMFLSQIGYTFNTGTIAPVEYLDRLLEQSKIARMGFIKYSTSADEADSYGDIVPVREERWYVEPKIKGEKFQGFKNILSGASSNIGLFMEFPGYSFDDIKVVFEGPSGNKTIQLSNPLEVKVTEKLPDELLKADGTIDESGLLKNVIEHINYYIKFLIISCS